MVLHIGPAGIAVLILVLLLGISYGWRRYRQAWSYVGFYRHISEDLSLYVINYNIKSDEVQLSHGLMQLLNLPRHLRHYSKWSDAVSKEPKDARYLIVRCLQAYDDDRLYRHRCQQGELHWFQLHSYMFRDNYGWAENIIGVCKDVTNQFQNETKLTVKAQIDGLTRLHNSGATRTYLAGQIGHSPRAVVLLIDVDYFKHVNDTFGHQAGDRVLRLVADSLRDVMQGRGYLGRLGGDEFCCYIDNFTENEDELKRMCEKLNHEVTRICREEEVGMPITVSIGAAVLEAGVSYETAYSRVDTALYQAKRLGRNSYQIFKEPQEQITEKES